MVSKVTIYFVVSTLKVAIFVVRDLITLCSALYQIKLADNAYVKLSHPDTVVALNFKVERLLLKLKVQKND